MRHVLGVVVRCTGDRMCNVCIVYTYGVDRARHLYYVYLYKYTKGTF